MKVTILSLQKYNDKSEIKRLLDVFRLTKLTEPIIDNIARWKSKCILLALRLSLKIWHFSYSCLATQNHKAFMITYFSRPKRHFESQSMKMKVLPMKFYFYY